MTTTLDALRKQMEAAAAAMDFEEAARLRDQLSLLGARPDLARQEPVDASRFSRQTPGAMGLGTSDQVMAPPPGWTPPAKPDLMTTGARKRRGRR